MLVILLAYGVHKVAYDRTRLCKYYNNQHSHATLSWFSYLRLSRKLTTSLWMWRSQNAGNPRKCSLRCLFPWHCQSSTQRPSSCRLGAVAMTSYIQTVRKLVVLLSGGLGLKYRETYVYMQVIRNYFFIVRVAYSLTLLSLIWLLWK